MDYRHKRIKPKRYYFSGALSEFYLTRRELQCVQGVLLGHTMASVAIMLGLSRRTVEFYLGNIKYKLQVQSLAELIKLCREYLKLQDQ